MCVERRRQRKPVEKSRFVDSASFDRLRTNGLLGRPVNYPFVVSLSNHAFAYTAGFTTVSGVAV
jgi:hypothetical protein